MRIPPGPWMAAGLCIACFTARASTQDARLEQIHGDVGIRGGGQTRFLPAQSGDILLYGDSVKIGPQAVAHVVFQNGDTILVRDKSTLTLLGSHGKTTVSFLSGEFLIGIWRNIAQGESFRVRTPSAVAAVRGTLFWGKVEANKATLYAAFGGNVRIVAKGRGASLKPGYMVRIPLGQAPENPKPHGITPDFFQRFALDGSIASLDRLLDPSLPEGR